MATKETSVICAEEVDLKKQPLQDEGPVGTVRLLKDDETYLIPTPTSDPRDPLNMKMWKKRIFVVTVALCRFSVL